jgi:hypothetical protein
MRRSTVRQMIDVSEEHTAQLPRLLPGLFFGPKTETVGPPQMSVNVSRLQGTNILDTPCNFPQSAFANLETSCLLEIGDFSRKSRLCYGCQVPWCAPGLILSCGYDLSAVINKSQLPIRTPSIVTNTHDSILAIEVWNHLSLQRLFATIFHQSHWLSLQRSTLVFG